MSLFLAVAWQLGVAGSTMGLFQADA